MVLKEQALSVVPASTVESGSLSSQHRRLDQPLRLGGLSTLKLLWGLYRDPGLGGPGRNSERTHVPRDTMWPSFWEPPSRSPPLASACTP